MLYDGVREVAERLEIDTALLHLGGVRFPVTGPLRYTMTARDAVELCRLMRPRVAIPIHYEGWTHFREGRAAIERELATAPEDISGASAGCRSASRSTWPTNTSASAASGGPARGARRGTAAAGGEAIEHGLHPSTYLPRKQVSGTEICRVRPCERDGVDPIIEQWQRERPELDSSPIGVVGRISRLAREIEARLEPVYREHGLEPGWHDVLATLRRSGPPRCAPPT